MFVPAAKVSFPPFVLKCAWRSDLTVSLFHQCRERPKADIHSVMGCCDAASPKQTSAALQNFGKGAPMFQLQ
jgi:hypothetical protein